MSIKNLFPVIAFFFLSFFVASCGGSGTSDGELPLDIPEEEINDPNLDVKPLEGNAFRVGDLQIVPVEVDSAAVDAVLQLKPSKATSLNGEQYQFNFEVSGLSAENSSLGNYHIGLILNNAADTTFSGKTFSMEFEEGDYQLLAFLADSTGKSLKSKKSHLIFDFSVGGTAKTTDAKEKMVFITSPVSRVSDSGEGILLDYLLFNAPLSEEDFHINIHVDDKEFFFFKHQPLRIKGLSKGKHTVTVQILDKYGKPLENMKNAISERTFEVK